MFPLRDNVDSQNLPIVTWLIIALNAFVFLIELSVGPDHVEAFLQTYGLVPSDFFAQIGLNESMHIMSSMFLHAGWAHLIGNMWFLFIFGDNVEDRMGHFRYLVFYLLAGICAAFSQMLISPHSQIALVGASGAISGVLGAYLLFFPSAKVLSLIPMGYYSRTTEIPAVFFLGFWFILQLFTGIVPLAAGMSQDNGGVAFWAHIGGFVFGIITCKLFDQGSSG
jgi:membrane associated rhomboid family serine protease